MSTPGFSAAASLRPTPITYQSESPRADLSRKFVPAQLPSTVGLAPNFGAGVDPRLTTQVGPRALSLSIPVYGNWCGPGFGGPNPPIDAVDQVCCRHDKCFDDRGFDDCSCNRDLLARMPAAITSSGVSAAGRAAGVGIIAALSLAPCLCHRACFPFFGCRDLPGPVGVPGVPGVHLCPPGFA
jgi:hypothetical protein